MSGTISNELSPTHRVPSGNEHMIKTKKEFDEHHRMLNSDLHSLFKLVFAYRKPLAEGDVRLASVILRKWLVGGLLGHFCKVAGVKPAFLALDTEEVCNALVGHPNINYFLTGGIRADGVPVQGIYHANVPSKKRPLIPVDAIKTKEFSLREFLGQKRLYFEGTFFSTEDIIKFTANKLGRPS